MNTIDRETVITAIEDAGLDPQALYDDYSGRGMYGKECFGIVVESTAEAVKFLIALARNLEAELADELADNWTTDSMGYGTIVYFPRFTVSEEDVDDD